MGAEVGVGKGPRSDINITPLVDVVLVLLIIFMVLTPLLEKEMAVRVPEDIDKNQVVPPPDPNDQPNQYIVRVDADGKFSINNNPLTPETGAEELKKYYVEAKRREAKDGPPLVFFDADDKTKYIHAIKALDMIRDSSPGWTIGMMTEKIVAPTAEGATPEGGAPAPAPTPPK